MRFSPMSFLAGLMVAGLVPLVARTARPLAVQATATALDAVEQAQRILAERREALDDLLAEARMQREVAVTASHLSGNGSKPPRRRARRAESAKPLSENRL
jgi:hypothetical protein